MILELTFTTGRYHATPWGRHVNEAAPEWPPSPFRIQRALLDAWFRKHASVGAEVIERLMKALARPPLFDLPPARSSHTRAYLSQNKKDTSDKKLVFDGFVVVDRGAKVLVGWPGLRLDGEALGAAQGLAESLNYLGRSETWIEARFIDDREVAWNCVPYAASSELSDKEEVSVAAVVEPSAYDRGEAPMVTEGRGRNKVTRRVTWFEALTWGSAEAIEHTMNRPPALEPVLYQRCRDSLDARLPAKRATNTKVIEGVLFAVEGKVAPSIAESLEVAERLRKKLMGCHRKVIGSDHISSWFSGKDEQGRPLEGHVHMSIHPLDLDEDGRIDRILVMAGQPLGPSERLAFDRIDTLWQRRGRPDLVLTPILWGRRDELRQAATRIVSMTPFVPPTHRHPKRDPDEWRWVVSQVGLECQRRGLPALVSVVPVLRPASPGERMRWLDFRRNRKGDTPRTGYGLRLEFAEPVQVPLSLGYASHYGLGTFVADGSALPI